MEFKSINLVTLQYLADNKGLKTIDPTSLYENGLIAKNDKFKVLGRGELKGAITVTAHAFSATAKAAIEAKGGSATTIASVAEKA